MTLSGWRWSTPLGAGEEARARVLEGETALRPPPPELSAYGIAALARVLGSPAPSPNGRYLHRMSLFGLEAATDLVAGWSGERRRLGVFTALGGLRALWEDLLVGMADQTPEGDRPWARGLGRVHPYWMLRHLSNNLHAALAIALGATGEGATLAGATGGAQALAAARRTLATGRLDAALVLGVDTLIQPEILLEGAISGRFAQTGPGEAAVALLLEADGDGPEICAEAGIQPGTLAGTPLPIDVEGALGQLGAATALAQVVVTTGLGPGTWIADSGGAPDLHARVSIAI